MNNNQRNYPNIAVGFGDQSIADIGCVVSALGNCPAINTTPDVVNARLKAVGGFSDGTTIGRGNLVVWSYIEKAFPGVKAWKYTPYDNNIALRNVPNVIVESPATPIGGRGSHWTNYIGNHQLKDSWTGRIRPTSDFPGQISLVVLTGKWNQQSGDDILLNDIKTVVDSSMTPHDKVVQIRQILA